MIFNGGELNNSANTTGDYTVETLTTGSGVPVVFFCCITT